jgi:hypothetical protein
MRIKRKEWLMLTKQIDIENLQSLDELLAELKDDTELILMRGNQRIARLSAEPTPGTPKKRKAGLHEGEIWMADDFNAQLPASFWLGEE